MINPLLTHIEKVSSVTIKESDLFESLFERRIYKKKELLLIEGQQCLEKFFIIKGCVHIF